MGLLPPTAYQDVIWELSRADVDREGTSYVVRVIENEADLFKPGARSRSGISGYPARLPPRSPQPTTTGSQRQMPPPNHFELESLGRQLWDGLPQEARQAFVSRLAAGPCRLKINATSPGLSDLPWEWLSEGLGPPFALRPNCRVTRSVPTPVPVPPLSVRPPIKVLVALTNPKEKMLLDPALEMAVLLPALNHPGYQYSVLDRPTLEGLVDALSWAPHILHYVGHTGLDRGGGNLIFQDEGGAPHWISGQQLAQILPMTVRLLCLSTPVGVPNYQLIGMPRLAEMVTSPSLPNAVANRYPVTMAGAQGFWQAFYAALAANGNTGAAFQAGQTAIASGTEPDWGSFSYTVRDSSGRGFKLQNPGLEAFAATDPSQELQAQMSSRIANELGRLIETYGDEPPSSLVQLYQEQAASARGEPPPTPDQEPGGTGGGL